MFGFVSCAEGWSVPAVLRNATSSPSRLIDADLLGPFSRLPGTTTPVYSTEIRTVRNVWVSRTKTSVCAFRSGPPAALAETRLVAAEVNATKRPSAELQGAVLSLLTLFAAPELDPDAKLIRSVGNAAV